MKPKRKSNLEEHTKRRALERFGIVLQKHELDRMVAHARRSKPIKIQSQNRRVCKVPLPNGVDALAVFDKKRQTIATLMPAEFRVPGRNV